MKSKISKASRASTTSSRTRALGAKAKEVELKTRIVQLDHVETAKREAERTRLMTECAIAAAVSKVYVDAIKEDAEQYLGSDDPDNGENNYNGLPNGCQLALKVLEHRLGQSAMIVQALKSSVTDGTNIRPGEITLPS